jgi:pimeloyl-ACP methyl ester carboxylesterase
MTAMVISRGGGLFVIAICVNAALLYTDSWAQDAATSAPTEVIENGTVAAERYGGDGTPLIFVPGLAGGAWSWSDMVKRFAATHDVYVLTLAGFDGRAPSSAPVIDKVTADITRLIHDRHLQKPILIGHSLGAFISYRVAIESADLIGGVIALDGFPVLPPLADANPSQRRAMADRLSDQLARGKTPQQFSAALHEFHAARMSDPEKARVASENAARSDPNAVAEYLVEMLTTDLRPQLGRIRAPILALVATESYKKGLPDAAMRAFYMKILANAPLASVVLIHNAHHFIAVDQPEAVGAAIEAYLDGLATSTRRQQ